MRITVVGTGYVGLVTGACLAHLGHPVTCMDSDPEKVRLLQAGKAPFFEPGLDELLAEQAAASRLRFAGSYEEAIPGAEAIFICVGTPPLPTGQADTAAVEAAARSIGEHLGPEYCVIINKSTVPIGSGDWVGMLIRQGIALRAGGPPRDPRAQGRNAQAAFDVVSNPEFLREGSAIGDALHPDRVVIGAESEGAVARMRELYAPLFQRNAALGREVPFLVTDRASAEMVKYAANAFLATKISFINEIANICERVGADVLEVSRGIGLDARIGSAFLNAGIGWGGSCFRKDLASLIHTACEYDYDARLLDAARHVNASQRMAVIRKLQERLKRVKGKTIALWGLAFKPGTDDLRDAPALAIAARLAELGAEVRAYDPQAMGAAARQGVEAQLCPDAYTAAQDADAVVLVTEWPEFAATDWSRLHALMRRPLIVDGRNTLDETVLRQHGFEYCGIGRK
jgi:UDPglucose 6-dehydrogenase